jgi:hypothetical protein
MPYDERWLSDLLARGQVRVVGSGGAGDRGQESADTPGRVRPHVSERVFQSAVVRVAKEAGWAAMHVHDSRRSPAGFPDLVLVRPPSATHPGTALFWELKSADGVVTLQQAHWLRLLCQVTRVEADIWRPEEWDSLVARLRG